MNEITTILAIYSPLLLLILILILIYKIRRVGNSQIEINFFGFFTYSIPIQSIFLARMIPIVIINILLIFYYISLDFAKFYPEKMKMTVHFNDVNGINLLLDELDVNSIDGLEIDKGNSIDRIKYFVEGDTVVSKYLDYNNYYSDAIVKNNSVLESEGETTFIVKKTPGIHNYRIVEAIGKLTHKRYIKKRDNVQTLKSIFNKTVSANDKVSISSIFDLFDKIIVAPKFNQSLVINGKEETLLDHNLYGITALYGLPFPSYSNTLYLYQHDNSLIPIGYAVYYPE